MQSVTLTEIVVQSSCAQRACLVYGASSYALLQDDVAQKVPTAMQRLDQSEKPWINAK